MHINIHTRKHHSISSISIPGFWIGWYLLFSLPLHATQYVFLGIADSLYSNPDNWSNQIFPPFLEETDSIIFSANSECLIRQGESVNGLGYTLINYGRVSNYGYFYLKSGNFLNESQSTWDNHGEMWFTSVERLENYSEANFVNYAKLIHRFSDFDNYGNLIIQDSTFSGNQGSINNFGLISVNSRLECGSLVNYSNIQNNSGGTIHTLTPSTNEGEWYNFFGSKLISNHIFHNIGTLNNETDSCIFLLYFRNDGIVNNYNGAHFYALGSHPTLGFENHGHFVNELNGSFNFSSRVTLPPDGTFTNFGQLNNLNPGIFTNQGSFIQEGQLNIPNIGFLNYGTLTGSGTIICEEVTLAGKCIPGGSGRQMKITSTSRNFLSDTSTLCIGISDYQENDTLVTNQELWLSGTLRLELREGFIPAGCTDFTVLTYASLGTFYSAFDSLSLPEVENHKWEIEYGDTEVILHLLPQSESNNCLEFGNITDHCFVEIPHSIGTLGTIEFRFFPRETNPAQPGQVLFNFNQSPYHYIKYLDDNILIQGETLTIFDTNGWLYTDYPFQSRWYHVAIVSDETKYSKIYIDGNEIPTYTLIDNPSEFDVSHALIGGGITEGSDSVFFAGKLDEVRFWGIPKPASFIRENYYKEIQSADGTLFAYYPMNQGLANSNNPCITNLKDLSQYGNGGTLTNFALSGSSCNWSESVTCSANFPEVNIFTGNDSNSPTDWFVGNNWSTGIPNACQYVLIPNGKTVELNAPAASCFQLEVQNGGTFSSGIGASLEILAPGH
ncbi:MAG: LamG domain-containing protein [Saprospiraceae bacterium]|nr:LamG domain-containing protein [Saprospiraceae bacterium]